MNMPSSTTDGWPVSTYRLQLTPQFTFTHAAAIVPYLARLGISDVYCSPIFRAKPGSTHGYDVCDFGELNPELGGNEAFLQLSRALQSHGMSMIVDFVPNHMAVEPVLNPWWRDMLEHGAASPFAKFFDVDWDPEKPELHGKILLPFLGEQYGLVLDRGELTLEYSGSEFVVRYFDATRPIDPRQYPRILRIGLDQLRQDMTDDVNLSEFLSIISALEHVPETTETNEELLADRLRECRVAKERIVRLREASPRIQQHIADAVQALNGTPGDARSFDALHDLLEALPFRLANWKTAVHEINYRRFFDINELAGLRVEEPATFTAMHKLILQLIHDKHVRGMRLDHIDGLFDPIEYLNQLKTETESAQPFYVVAEKILTGSETLPEWQALGTTGYEFMNDVSRLLVHPRNAGAMRRTYQEFTGLTESFTDIVYDCKKLITWTSLASELNVLAHSLNRISESDRHSRDFTLDSLREALREVAVCFPVYRTYVSFAGMTEADKQVVDLAMLRARRRNPAMESSVFDFVRESLLPDREKLSQEEYEARLRFAMKFQQYTGPLQAKGVEDTAFYRHNALVSLNEVGGDPQRFGGTVAQFHQANLLRASQSPRGMLSTATHDTKRGEDARSRIHAIAEVPRGWRKYVQGWSEINAECRTIVDGISCPDRNDEFLFYQVLVGCWPAGHTEADAPEEFVARVREYMRKAIKESKVHTSWITANEGYDLAVTHFVDESLRGARSKEFLEKFLPFQQKMARVGVVNSLVQLVLKLTSPGVPDCYQGTEFWDLSLVDPDNRRVVDYAQRDAALQDLESTPPDQRDARFGDALMQWHDARIKLFVSAVLLKLRRVQPDLFLNGEYVPLESIGEHSEHLVGFIRRNEHHSVLVAVPRLTLSMPGGRRSFPLGADAWSDTQFQMPEEYREKNWQNVFLQTPTTTSAAELFHTLPIAVCRMMD